MTQPHDDPKENAAGSEVRADAPVRGVRTAGPLLAICTPCAASGRGVFVSSRDNPTFEIHAPIPRSGRRGRADHRAM